MSLTSSVRQKLIGEHRTHERDTGSPEVQVAILTEHIKQLTDHLRLHPKDYSSRRGLLAKVNRRNKLLRYLKRTDPPRYGALVNRLELRR